MTIDLVFGGLVILFGVLGFLSGFWGQLIRLGALIGSYLLAGPVGKAIGPSLARSLEISPLIGVVLGTLLAFLLLYAALSITGALVLRAIRRRRGLGQGKPRWDRIAGAALGVAKTFLLLFLALNALVLMEKPAGKVLDNADLGYRDSVMVSLARDHNLLSGIHLPVVGNLETLSRLASDPEAQRRLAEDPKVKQLLAHPKVRRLLGDPALIEASEGQDVSALLANPRLAELIGDPEIQQLLSEIELNDP